jgi:multiple sugar transport system substrate-binding protein
VITIKDVARLAGVSHGTVSNVLNGKAGVALDKVQRVNEVVARLGYVPSQTAKNLKTNASTAVAVILPNIMDPHFSRLFTGVERILSEAGYSVSLYITGEILAKEREILGEIHRNRSAGVIIASCAAQEEGSFGPMESTGIKLVFVEREHVSRKYNFVEIDSYSLVRSATKSLLERGRQNIVLVVGPEEYSCEGNCIRAYRDAYGESGLTPPEHLIRITNFDRESAFREAMSVFEGSTLPEAVVTSSNLLMDGVLAAYRLTKSFFPIEPEFTTLAEDSWTNSAEDHICKIRRQSVTLGEKAAELLLENIKVGNFHSPRRMKIEDTKQGSRTSTVAKRFPKSGHPLRVLMLEGTHARAVAALVPDFQASTGIEVEIVTEPYTRMYGAIREACEAGETDVVQVDIPWLPELTRNGLLADLTRETEIFPETIGGFIPGILDTYARIDGRVYAYPYLFGSQLLFYRKDLFADETVRHAYRAKFKTELRPPETWPEFNAVARFFTRELNPASPVAYGTTLGARVSSGAVCEFLPRQWGFGGETFGPHGEITLESPENIWALESYRESFLYASPGSQDHWWDEQVKEFSAGEAAMMMLFVAHATEISDRKTSKVVGRLGYSQVPGGTGLLGGWSLAIPASSRDRARAFAFLAWATGSELAIPTTVLGSTTSSLGLYKSSELLSLYPWLPKALESFSSSRKRVFPELFFKNDFSEQTFETILGSAVHDCVIGALDPRQALFRASNELKNRLDVHP